MKLTVSDPVLVRDLVAYLRDRPDYVVFAHPDGSVEVGVLGSHADGGRLDVDLYLRAWEASHAAAVTIS